MRCLAILLATLVAGCATPSKVAMSSPFYAAPSAKGRAIVTGCISHAWRDTFGFRTRLAESDDHTSIIMSTGNVSAVDMIADVFEGGRTEVRERQTAWGWLDGDLRKAVQQCL